jgi:23S rRNA (adenine-N6)-dimethyltransferase
MSLNIRKTQCPPYRFSQNFLTSGKTIGRLLRLTDIGPSDHVLEIGPGKGHITKALSKRADSVTAVEIDPVLCRKLCEKFSPDGNVCIVNRDFLKYKLPVGRYKVFSNIPFCRTGEIIERLTRTGNPPEETWLIMEKGAAKRFSGKPCETKSSLMLKPFFETGIVYYFSRQDFHPAPSVDAVLLHLRKKKTHDIQACDRPVFERFIERCFSRGIYSVFTKKQIDVILRRSGLPGIERSGDILYVQWLCLFRCYRRFCRE